MPAKKAGVKGAKKTVAKGAKKAAGKGRKLRTMKGCVDTPSEFFTGVVTWADAMFHWATDDDDIKDCFEKPDGCGTDGRRKRLKNLCKEFRDWAKVATDWANEVEECWQEKCEDDGGPNHTPPPPPPF